MERGHGIGSRAPWPSGPRVRDFARFPIWGSRLGEKAIELDPNYAHAYVLLAFVHTNLGRYNWTEDADRSLDIGVE